MAMPRVRVIKLALRNVLLEVVMPDSPTFIAKVEGRRLVLPALREPQLRLSQSVQQYALQNDDVETRRLELPKMLVSQLLQQGNLPGKRLRCEAASPLIRAFSVVPAVGTAGCLL